MDHPAEDALMPRHRRGWPGRDGEEPPRRPQRDEQEGKRAAGLVQLVELEAPAGVGDEFDHGEPETQHEQDQGRRQPVQRLAGEAPAPARLQRLSSGRLVDLVPQGAELWLDGGHNPDGGRAAAAALADLEDRVSRPLVMIVGMLSTKDASGFLRNFTGLARRMITIPVPGADKGLSAEDVAAAATAVGVQAVSRGNIDEALDAVRKLDLDPPPPQSTRTLIRLRVNEALRSVRELFLADPRN